MKHPNKFNSQLQHEILDSFQQLVKVLIKTLLEALILEERDRGISGRRISGKIIIKDSGHLLPLRKR